MFLTYKRVLQAAAVWMAAACNLSAQTPLSIPPVLSGTTFNLGVQEGSEVFYDSTVTPTLGINGDWMAPTLIVNRDDSIQLNVHNNLGVPTTLHWHGMHVAPENDGGPHQIIPPGTTWGPSFKVRNQAGTFWYHPHGAGQTDPQVSGGIAGMLIVRDAAEAALALPRTYGTDDFPVIVQTRAFDELQQIAIATEMDTAIFVNGTLHPYLNAPAQVVRLRLLNGSSARVIHLGTDDNRTFWQIATDGGLRSAPLPLTRLLLGPGERAEILLDLSGLAGDSLQLMSYGSEMPDGIYGSANVGMGADTIMGYSANFLNGADFNLLQIRIVPATPGAVTVVPSSLVPYTPLSVASAIRTRTFVLDTLRALPIDPPNLAHGPFGINARAFDMDSINATCYLDDTEIWNLVNNTHIAHPFHVHDVQFNIIERSGLAPLPSDSGWKDVVLVMPHDSVKFVTRFEDFADPMVPYMYHCHMLHHEDDGMMGSFLVLDTNSVGISAASISSAWLEVFPNPASREFNLRFNVSPGSYDAEISIYNSSGRILYTEVLAADAKQATLATEGWPSGPCFIVLRCGNLVLTHKLLVLNP